MKSARLLALTLLLCCVLYLFSAAQPPNISFNPVITGLAAPVDLVNAGDGSNRLFIVQQGGQIKVWNGSTLLNFIDLSGIISTGGERGLLSMAFHPDYDGVNNRYFFVYYTDLSGNIAISRYQSSVADKNIGDPASAQLILTIGHPGQSNHNGGKLNFGPDGNLYFATGDGGGGNDVPNNAQNPLSLLGKMIRINVDNFNAPPYYTVPADNPYVGNAAFDPRIYNLGLRNPFRWSFDQNGNMWIGDVGQNTKEEIDFRAAGNTGHNNFGWRCFEGYISTPGVADCMPADNVFPVFDYDNPGTGAAVTGGYVYRGPDYPIFRGYYMAKDVYSGTIYFLWPNGSGGFDSALQSNNNLFIVGFGEDENARLYAVSQSDNAIFQVVAAGGTPLPVVLGGFSGKHFPGYNELKWTTLVEQNLSRFLVEFSSDGIRFERVGLVEARYNPNGGGYVFRHSNTASSRSFYRLAMEDDDGSLKYSSVISVLSNEAGVHIYPTLVRDQVLHFVSSTPLFSVQLINTSGALVFEQELNGLTGSGNLFLPSLPAGLYVIHLILKNGMVTEKILLDQ
ncbi:MAG: PQQ-dependent sugar dehydrogenase [Flavisolibacter sp.]